MSRNITATIASARKKAASADARAHAGEDGTRGFAVELLEDDGAREGAERAVGLVAREPRALTLGEAREGARRGDDARERRVRGGDVREGVRDEDVAEVLVARLIGARGARGPARERRAPGSAVYAVYA